MRNQHWPNKLGTIAGQKREQSLVEETRQAQARADVTELVEIQAALRGLKDRVVRLQGRYDMESLVEWLDQADFSLTMRRNKAMENRK